MFETEGQNILKIVRRLLETRLETSMKKEADKIRKYGKKNWKLLLKKVKFGEVTAERRKNIC